VNESDSTNVPRAIARHTGDCAELETVTETSTDAVINGPVIIEQAESNLFA